MPPSTRRAAWPPRCSVAPRRSASFGCSGSRPFWAACSAAYWRAGCRTNRRCQQGGVSTREKMRLQRRRCRICRRARAIYAASRASEPTPQRGIDGVGLLQGGEVPAISDDLEPGGWNSVGDLLRRARRRQGVIASNQDEGWTGDGGQQGAVVRTRHNGRLLPPEGSARLGRHLQHGIDQRLIPQTIRVDEQRQQFLLCPDDTLLLGKCNEPKPFRPALRGIGARARVEQG